MFSAAKASLTIPAGRRTMGRRPSGEQAPERLIQPGELTVTQQYIIGELSVRLVELEAVAPNKEFACECARLRAETESAPFEALPYLALHALHLIRGLCRDLLRAVTSRH